jgi:hypothetical protein
LQKDAHYDVAEEDVAEEDVAVEDVAEEDVAEEDVAVYSENYSENQLDEILFDDEDDDLLDEINLNNISLCQSDNEEEGSILVECKCDDYCECYEAEDDEAKEERRRLWGDEATVERISSFRQFEAKKEAKKPTTKKEKELETEVNKIQKYTNTLGDKKVNDIVKDAKNASTNLLTLFQNTIMATTKKKAVAKKAPAKKVAPKKVAKKVAKKVVKKAAPKKAAKKVAKKAAPKKAAKKAAPKKKK